MATNSSSLDDISIDLLPNPKRSRIVYNSPNQPRDITFPNDPTTSRRFLPSWFDKFPWLEWDTHLNAAFCHTCKQAYSIDRIHCSKSEEAFISKGFKNWKKALEKFKIHETSLTHRSFIVKYANMKSPQNICEIFSSQLLNERKTARESLKRIFTSLRYLTRQRLPTRGHIDSESNFKQPLHLRTSYSEDLQNWL